MSTPGRILALDQPLTLPVRTLIERYKDAGLS
jgi:hypothetical protein